MAAQLPDIVYVDGKVLNMYSNPLEHYWIEHNRPRPLFIKKDNCLRGYIAFWCIADNQLLLKSIESKFSKRIFFGWKRERPYTLNNLFPKAKEKPVKAIWYSGKLRIPTGKMTMFEDMGYESRFERELIITINKGEVVKSVILDFTKQELTVKVDEDDILNAVS